MPSTIARAFREVMSSRFGLPLVLLFAVMIASGVYVQWRHSRLQRQPGVAEADTMCFASHIGLPCQQ
jgi:hypothetical protein